MKHFLHFMKIKVTISEQIAINTQLKKEKNKGLIFNQNHIKPISLTQRFILLIKQNPSLCQILIKFCQEITINN